MRKRLIAFDLDGTLAETKSPISDVMAVRLGELLRVYEVCVISGGAFEQFETQLIDRLELNAEQKSRLHIMPTSGTRYLRFDGRKLKWIERYARDLDSSRRVEIVEVLTAGAKTLGYWQSEPYGELIEDRGSQITFSALGQEAPAHLKHEWDPDGEKKRSMRAYTAVRLPDLEVRIGGTTSIDVTESGIDKAYGMTRLMELLGMTNADILFFGDKLEEGGNDYPVKAMGIDSIQVRGWEETVLALDAILAVSR